MGKILHNCRSRRSRQISSLDSGGGDDDDEGGGGGDGDGAVGDDDDLRRVALVSVSDLVSVSLMVAMMIQRFFCSKSLFSCTLI